MVVYEFGPFRLDAEALLLYCDGAAIALGPKVVETLLALVEHPGEMLSKRALLERVWPDGYVEEANLAQNIYVLRKLLRARRCGGAIQTIARRGYRFALPVSCGERSAIPRPRRGWLIAASVAAALLFGFGSYAYAISRERPAPPSLAVTRLLTIGKFFLEMRSENGMKRSINFFSRAIALSPNYARPYAARARAYALMADYGYGPIERERALATADAEHALALNPQSGSADAALGLLARAAGRNDEALRRLATAIALAPNDADAHEWYGLALFEEGRVDDADAELHVAQRIDPLSIAVTSWLASIAYLQRHYGEAIADAREGLVASPKRSMLWRTLGLAQEAQGDDKDAIASFTTYERSCAACRAEGAALLAYTYARLNRVAAARAELALASAPGATPRPQDLVLALSVAGGRGVEIGALARQMTASDRVFVANDPRFGRLPNAELRLLERD